MQNKWIERILTSLIFLTLLTPVWVFKELLFPFVTSKAFALRIVVELALPFYLFLIIVKKNARPNWKNPVTIAVVSFWVINLASSFFGVNIFKSLWGNFERMGGTYYMLHLTLLYFYLLALSKLSPRGFSVFLKTLVWGAAVLSLYGIFLKMGMTPIITDPSLPSRISIFFGNPIYVGSFMILPIFLGAFFALQSEEAWEKYAYWIMVLLQAIAVYLSGTRGAVVGLVVGLFLGAVAYIFMVKNKKIRSWGIVSIVLIFGLFGILYTYHESLPQGSTLRRVFNLNDSNTQSRLVQWKTAISGLPEYWLTGTGPENYYIVGNKYHNPEIAKYDRSWFDKPHNFLLEVLVTTGIFGFLAYLGIVLTSIYGSYRAYKAQFFGLLEFLVLATGVVVYQLQNLFVFDNVSTTLTFFIFTAFCAFLLEESSKELNNVKLAKEKFVFQNINFASTVLAVSGLLTIYAVWVTNIQPISAAKAVNFGYAYASVDPQKAFEYFKTAVDVPFNFDFGETSMRFSDFGSGIAQRQDVPLEQRNEIFNKSLEVMKNTVEKIDNYPIYWYRYANMLFVRDGMAGKQTSEEGEVALQKAIELAPKRTEARELLAQIRIMQKRYDEGLEIMKGIIADEPQNLDHGWFYASFLNQAGKTDEAVQAGEELFTKGFKVRSWQDANWLVGAYMKKAEFKKAIAIYVSLADDKKLDPEGYLNLATLYAQNGEKAKAKEIAEKVVASDSKYQARVVQLLQSLQIQ